MIRAGQPLATERREATGAGDTRISSMCKFQMAAKGRARKPDKPNL